MRVYILTSYFSFATFCVPPKSATPTFGFVFRYQVNWLKYLNTVLRKGNFRVNGDYKFLLKKAGYFKAAVRVMNNTKR